MSYRAMAEMAVSNSLTDRIAACMAVAKIPAPRLAAQENIMRIVATTGWADAWQYAVNEYHINQNPDTGARTDVIDDEMILDAINGLLVSIPTTGNPATGTDASGGVNLIVPDDTGMTSASQSNNPESLPIEPEPEQVPDESGQDA